MHITAHSALAVLALAGLLVSQTNAAGASGGPTGPMQDTSELGVCWGQELAGKGPPMSHAPCIGVGSALDMKTLTSN